MSCLRSTHLSSVRLVALLAAVLFAAAACSSSTTVATEETPETVDSTTDATAEDEVAADDDVAVEVETDAMGEEGVAEDGGVETTIDPPADDSATGTTARVLDEADLTAALEAGTSDRFSLPFMYLTVEQDCDGCAETMSLYYVPSAEKASILTLDGAYIDGVAQSDFSAVDPSLQAGDPRRIAEQLTGTDATYGIDPVSGAITSWTLDGDSVTLRCLQVDTRPIDMRTELCENSVIG